MSDAERHCARCGAILPEEDEEVICPGCGFAYGSATVAIEVSTDELLAEIERQKGAFQQEDAGQVELSVSKLINIEENSDSDTNSPAGHTRLVALAAGLVGLIVVAVAVLVRLMAS